MAGSKVDDLIKKRDQLNAKIQAAKSKETQKVRKQQTQAKILLGQALLSRLENNDGKAEDIYGWCRDTLTDKDKARLDAAMKISTVTIKLRGEDPQSVNSNQKTEKMMN